ncbi:MAG: PD-(D/E)XK nuclease family protein [Prevotella sp.]|nr:PD-(D/E)XK nuclease family protein [Prevotella sp.]
MKFLEAIAKDILEKYGTDLHEVTVVFPNKRAALFLNKALTELCDHPIWSPRYTTISELFQSLSELRLADRIKLICELHKSYCHVTGKDETLEQFYGWGEVMLSDFDDIDKHLGDAKKIFTLLSDIHELDSVDYLTPEKVEILKGFFRNFSTDHSTVLKERFLELWNRFYDIYEHYRQSLLSQGIAYEGMLYRKTIEISNLSAPALLACKARPLTSHLFIGFNLLTPVEQLLITKLGGKIYNDDDTSCPPEEVSIISSPTDDLQARYVTQWLTPERIQAGRRTAIVLADEGLLETVLHCLPSGISLNITTGYPLSQASITSLVKVVTTLLQRGSYTLHNINAVLRHPLTRYLSLEVTTLHDRLNRDMIYYLTPEDVSVDDNLRQLFAPLQDKESPLELTNRLIWLTRTIAKRVQEVQGVQEESQLDSEALYRMFTILNRIKSLIEDDDISISATLYAKLLNQVIQTTTIPFHGEPIEGIQVMGVLETRNLDFDHVLLLSCNEGNLPARINDTSFLPHSIRQGYDLTTIENKVSIYHYYFDRLLQRTKDVTILYNNSTNDGKTGEMSRFMLQLIAESPIPIKRYALQATTGTPTETGTESVDKTPEMVQQILGRVFLSPSALGKYLRCQMEFYYRYIENLDEDEDSDQEEMDSRAFGTIFHRAAELLYQDFVGKVVPRDYMERLLREKGHTSLRRFTEQAFREKLFNLEGSTRKTPKLNGLQVINFEIVVQFLINLLRYDLSLTRLEIVALEKTVKGTISVPIPVPINVNIGGNIDRLDIVTDTDGVRRMRVIDYKTGRLTRRLNLNNVDEIFMPSKLAAHTNYFLQALLYASILNDQTTKQPDNQISTGLLYVQHAHQEDYDPLLSIDGHPIKDASIYMEQFREGLTRLISEILDTNVPFRRTDNDTFCTDCPFHHLCY